MISHGCLFSSSTLPTQNQIQGGPLVDENNVQVGVVSFGFAGEFTFACHVIVLSGTAGVSKTIDFLHIITGPDRVTNPKKPDGFARVSFFCDWIENQVCADVPNDQVFCREIAQPTTQPTTQPTSSRSSKSGKSTKQAKAAN